MSEIMRQLRDDHRNVALMMDLLERQLDAVHRMERADFDLMHDVMRYMTRYPDQVHHPKEDLMFERMGADEPGLARAIEDILSLVVFRPAGRQAWSGRCNPGGLAPGARVGDVPTDVRDSPPGR